MRRWRGLIGPLLVCLAVLAVLAARARLDVVEVRGRSMAPTLHPGDRLLAVRLRRRPRPREVVLSPDPRSPSRELVKRVIAVDDTGVALRGDNPAFSTDGRVFGVIPGTGVRWRVVGRYWPLRRAGRLPSPPLTLGDEGGVRGDAGEGGVRGVGGEPACPIPESLIAGWNVARERSSAFSRSAPRPPRRRRPPPRA